MFSVTISEKGGQQTQHDFSKPQITIGRMKGNDIVLPKGNVSKQHTRIFMRNDDFFIVDLKSTNGTYVNGRKVTSEQPLKESDKIYIGDFILQLQRQSAQQPQQPVSPPQPPPASPGGGGRPGKRNFPTVMDDAVDRSAGAQGSPSRTGSNSGGPSGGPPKRQSSGGGQPGVTPSPEPGGDLRKTFGDSGPADLSPNIEPLDNSPSQPTPPSQPSQPSPPSQPSQPSPGSAPSSAPSQSGADMVSPGRSPERSGRPAGSTPGVSALESRTPVENEFDADFHRTQQDVTRLFLKNIAASELSLEYPLEDRALETRVQAAIQKAVTTAGAGGQKQELTDIIGKEALGLGPLEDYLDDDSVQAIYINAYDRIVLRREGKLVVAARAYSHPDMLDLTARRLLGPHDTPPVSDEVRFGDGTRVHILMPPVAIDGPALTVRKPNREFPVLEELVDRGVMSTGMAEFLQSAVEAGRSMLIAGPTSSGKTTLLAALAQSIPESSRVVALEQYSNLQLDLPNFVRLEASPATGFDMRYLLNNAVAMHPDRILLDECRGAEAYEWVTAAASGTAGSIATLHGTSSLDALSRFESLCLLAASDISPRGLREQVARSVDLVIVLNNRADGGFRIQQIAEVQGVDLDAFRLNDIFYFRVEGTSGAFHPTGYIPLFYEDLRHAGFDVNLGIFRE